jgi:hypothetical protein
LEASDSEPTPEIPSPPANGGADDSFARKEADFLQGKRQNLAGWAEENQIKRDEMLRHCFFYAVAALIVLAALLFAATLCIWAWHLAAPDNFRWLSKEELDKLQVLVFSGAASSLATVIGKRVIGGPPSNSN